MAMARRLTDVSIKVSSERRRAWRSEPRPKITDRVARAFTMVCRNNILRLFWSLETRAAKTAIEAGAMLLRYVSFFHVSFRLVSALSTGGRCREGS